MSAITALLLTLANVAPAAADAGQEGAVVLVAGRAAHDPQVRDAILALAPPGPDGRPGERLVLLTGPPDAPPPYPPALLGGARTTLAVLVPGIDPERGRPQAEEPALAAAADRAELILLGGGDWLDWWQALVPARKKRSTLAVALDRAWRRGAPIVLQGGAASFVALGLLNREELAFPPRNPRRLSKDVAVVGPLHLSAAFLDVAGVDEWSGLRRLLRPDVPVWLTHRYHLHGDVAWFMDGDGNPDRLMGSGALLVAEVLDRRADRHSVRRAHLAILRAGDRWDDRRLRPIPVETDAIEPGAPAEPRKGLRTRRVPDALDAAVLLRHVEEALCAERKHRLVLIDGEVTVDLECVSDAPCGEPGRPGGALHRLKLRLDWVVPSGVEAAPRGARDGDGR